MNAVGASISLMRTSLLGTAYHFSCNRARFDLQRHSPAMEGKNREKMRAVVVLRMQKEENRDVHARGLGGQQGVDRAEQSGTHTADPQK
jgi:hypothetical protein